MMIEFLFVFLMPSVFSLILYFYLKSFSQRKKRLKIVLALSIIYLLLPVILNLIPVLKGPGIHNAIISLSLLFLAIACAQALSMNVFPHISDGKKPLAAFLTPFISVPFLILAILGESWPGKPYGNQFSATMPLIGWIIDPFTKDWLYSSGTDIFLSILRYYGFFLEMIILMFFLFWYMGLISKSGIKSE